MTYSVRETSVHDSEPIECFKFIGPLGTYRYTDNPIPIVVDDEEYTPVQITRTAFEVSTNLTSVVTMDFTVPIDTQLAKDYAFLTTPETLRVEVRRIHRGDADTDFQIVWVGIAAGTNVTGRQCTIETTGSIYADLLRGVNTVYYQTICNHVLYDERCKVSRIANTTLGTVTAIGALTIVVNDDGVADHDLKGGEIINNRTGERRMVADNLANSIDINYGFLDIVEGDVVSMVRGCDHSSATCKAKFNNFDNYGGFLFIPTKNPYDGGLE